MVESLPPSSPALPALCLCEGFPCALRFSVALPGYSVAASIYYCKCVNNTIERLSLYANRLLVALSAASVRPGIGGSVSPCDIVPVRHGKRVSGRFETPVSGIQTTYVSIFY